MGKPPISTMLTRFQSICLGPGVDGIAYRVEPLMLPIDAIVLQGGNKKPPGLGGCVGYRLAVIGGPAL
jgi:hypothetical protein